MWREDDSCGKCFTALPGEKREKAARQEELKVEHLRAKVGSNRLPAAGVVQEEPAWAPRLKQKLAALTFKVLNVDSHSAKTGFCSLKKLNMSQSKGDFWA